MKRPRKNNVAGSDAGSVAGGTPAKKPASTWRPPKYPIEDLDLDPMTIYDGRLLRRVNVDLPDLPPKPRPRRDLLVPQALFSSFISVWNVLNIFSSVLRPVLPHRYMCLATAC